MSRWGGGGIDLHLALDQLRCRLFGHADPHPMDEEIRLRYAPYQRPRCPRCGRRLDRSR